MSAGSHSALPSPEDWEWFKALLEKAEALPEDVLPPGGRIAWMIEQTREFRPAMVPFVERHASHMLESETRVLSRPSLRMLEMDSWPAHLFDTGDLVGNRYTVTRFLGAGGMGEVYEVEDSELQGRSVALKTIRGDLAGTRDADSRFEREVRAALAVSHSNVCRIYDVGRHKSGPTERLFLTMELLTGTLLSEHVRPAAALKSNTAGESAPTVTVQPAQTAPKGRAAEKDALKIIRQLAAGLAAIHSEGIVHRDFKPANVMLVPEPDGSLRAVIMDFGLARVLDLDLELAVTQTGLHPGTPAYMAPEQLTGSGPSTFASDVYSLGVTMHEILTGRRYELNGSFKALHRAGVSPWLREVVIRCLQADRLKRYQNANEAAAALDERERHWFRPRSRAVAAAAVVTALACVPAGVWFVRRPSPPPAVAVRAYMQGLDDLHAAAPFLATTRFQEALRFAPHYGAASARLAQAWLDMEAYGRARESILSVSSETVQSLDASSRDLYEAVRYCVLGEHAKSIPLFERLAATAQEEDKTNALIDLGWELDRAGQGAKAAKIWESLAAASPYAALRAATGTKETVTKRLDQALAGFEAAHNMEGESQVIYKRAVALPSSEGEQAKKLLETVAERARMSHDVYQEARAHLQLAFLELNANETAEGEAQAAEAMQIARRGNVEVTFAIALRTLGTTSQIKGNRVKAEQYFLDSLRLARENRDPIAEAGALHLLADVHNRMGRPDAGEIEASQAYNIYSTRGMDKLSLRVLKVLAISRREQGKFDLAEEAMALARKVYSNFKEPDPELLDQIEECHGQLERLRGKYPAAARHLKLAIEAGIASKYRLAYGPDTELLAEDLAMAGDLAGASAALDKLSADPSLRTDVAVRRLFIDFYAAPQRVAIPRITSLLNRVTDPEDRVELQIILLQCELRHRNLSGAARLLDGPMSAPDPYLRRESKLDLRLARAQGFAALGRKADGINALGNFTDFRSHDVLAWRAALTLSQLADGAEASKWRTTAKQSFQVFRTDYEDGNARMLLNNRRDLTAEWKQIELQSQ